ncbi:putative transcriptional regulator [Hoeflea sp. IMCC20628]|uniref:ArsR/SmtB family transcription factor n=1 Tax=Hoeflea sp. IMCC20628 TaxID=1620421 RepID=UPI00063B0223|nr:metalloregulator ArsR/SmtB family transcription factor [Hoeflea sp. IMCC20628]AKI02540.1 putative transcriptional regulator [Hoeflea sp. IMCC20628]
MNAIEAAQGFSAMGSESRLEVLQALVRAGEDGLRVGDIQERTGIAASTLAHHLKFLSAANLIVQRKQGRIIMSTANFDYLTALAGFILENCCSEAGAKP